jgi:hypothetical protein
MSRGMSVGSESVVGGLRRGLSTSGKLTGLLCVINNANSFVFFSFSYCRLPHRPPNNTLPGLLDPLLPSLQWSCWTLHAFSRISRLQKFLHDGGPTTTGRSMELRIYLASSSYAATTTSSSSSSPGATPAPAPEGRDEFA